MSTERRKTSAADNVHTSPRNLWFVWEMSHGFGVYNISGVKVAYVDGKGERRLDMAKAIADMFDGKDWTL